MPRFQACKLDQLVDHRVEISNLNRQSGQIALWIGGDSIFKSIDGGAHRRQGCSQIVSDTGEQQVPSLQDSLPVGLGLSKGHHHLVNRSCGFADLVIAGDARVDVQIARADLAGNIAQPTNVNR